VYRVSPIDWLGFVATLISVLGSAALGVKWLVKHYLAELKPNGGSSIKDKVNELDSKVDRLETRIDEIYGLLVKKRGSK
jgi:uncharacterized protein Yka (UPF0111/DUF47 family)